MISPQHLINTGICGLFCVTLFSLAAVKTPTKPIVVTQPVSIGQDYTLHIKTGKVPQRISSHAWTYEVQNERTLQERNEEARRKRAQFEELFKRSPNEDGAAREIAPAVTRQLEEPDAILRRARNVVHRGIDAGADVNQTQR